MQASRTVPATHSNLLLWALAILGVGLLSLLPLVVLDGGPSASTSTAVPATANSRVVYLEFGREADTLWVADVANPNQRERRFAVAHAPEFGIIPSLAPDRRSFVYTALPANTRAPTPETPAELWLADLDADAKPRLLSRSADLLVSAVWSPSGETIVFRRSRALADSLPTGQRLVALDVSSGQERELVAGNGASVFPAGFSADGRSLYYVHLDPAGSDLLALNLASGGERLVARLSDSLTRDWKLCLTGDRIAYLAMKLDGGSVASRAFVVDLNSGAVTTLGADSDAFNPTWDLGGELVFGSLGGPAAEQSGITRIFNDGRSRLTETVQGFDVPLGFDPKGQSLAVRNFDGATTVAPGRERLDVLLPGGSRKTITTAEVTFLGWIDP